MSSAELLPFALGGELPQNGSMRAVHSNLYFAPAFEHKPRHSTFLLIRERNVEGISTKRKQTDDGVLSWREVGNVLLLGQQQPVEQQERPHILKHACVEILKGLMCPRLCAHIRTPHYKPGANAPVAARTAGKSPEAGVSGLNCCVGTQARAATKQQGAQGAGRPACAGQGSACALPPREA